MVKRHSIALFYKVILVSVVLYKVPDKTGVELNQRYITADISERGGFVGM